MNVVFYLAAAVAIAATVMVITRHHAVHALLYLIVSLLAIAVVFYALGAPFIAALEVIIYAGAIMALMVFVMMMLNLGDAAAAQERLWLQPHTWWGPAVLALILGVELLYVLMQPGQPTAAATMIGPRQVVCRSQHHVVAASGDRAASGLGWSESAPRAPDASARPRGRGGVLD